MSEETPLNVRVADALGWTAYEEERGEYKLAIACRPGAREPWASSQRPTPQRYRKITCAEAKKLGFFGSGFPNYDTDWSVTGPLVEKYEIGLREDGCGYRQEERWLAEADYYGPPIDESDKEYGGRWASAQSRGPTPLIAVCNLILELGKAGKL